MLKEYSENMANELSTFIIGVFDQYVGKDYTDEGRKTFYDYVAPEKINQRVKSGSQIITYTEGDQLIGAMELKNGNHISLFFVKGDYHNRGIGQKIFSEFLRRIGSETNIISVNSSIFAKPIYERLGFTQTADVSEKDGIIYIPMTYTLNRVSVKS